jgi:ribulose-bisphosphate carboxylase large chain
MERLFATYLIQTPLAVEKAAAVLAGEQSSGTFVAVPGETEELKNRFAARVEKITPLEIVSEPSLPGCRGANDKFQRAEIIVSWSVENFGFNLPTLISTVQGNLYELPQFSGLKLMDLEFPPSFAKHFHGPKFGIAGCRKLTGAKNRPLIGTIIKPSIGMSPRQTAELVKILAEAGIDFIKDDELMANPPHSPFDERVDAIMRIINAHADRTGKKVMYAFNVSDELDAMQRHYEKIVSAGGTCAMISLNSVGLAGAKKICDLGALAIHGHRNGWGMLNRHPLLGIKNCGGSPAWIKSTSTASRINFGKATIPSCARSNRVYNRCSVACPFCPSFPQANGAGRRRKHFAGRKPWICFTWPAAASWRIRTAQPPACARCKNGGRRQSKD